MSRLLFTCAYDGAPYCGWQSQREGESIQDTIEAAMARILKAPLRIAASGRTDAGVHALGFAASFLSPERPFVPPERIPSIINTKLPPAIRVMSIREADISFHTRYDAVGKSYTYVFNLGNETPFDSRYSWHSRRKLDVEAMIEGSRCLIGTHDFSSFVVERNMIPEAVRTIYSIDFAMFGKYLCITYKGNGFLYKMIRCLTGLLEAVGTGRLKPEDCQDILEAKKRSAAPETAPARGLFLMKVFFEQQDIETWKLEKLPFA